MIEANEIKLPKQGVRAIAGSDVMAFESSADANLVFIIDNFNFESRTKTKFLLSEVESLPNARFIIVSKNKTYFSEGSEFVVNTGAAVSKICDVSFLEIAAFLQKNFEMAGPASEVVAVRLRETFTSFKLPVHPTYFAGIPQNTLMALLQANRRAELIELAVAGYLSYVVSQDDEPIALSRTTRERFLSHLAFETNVGKNSYTEAELVSLTERFAKKFDYKISPTKFIASFIVKGILHIEGNKIRFTLPFMESYLLAKRLQNEPAIDNNYFELGEADFDLPTFIISAELGLSDTFVMKLLASLDRSIEQLKPRAKTPPALIGENISPTLLNSAKSAECDSEASSTGD